MIYRASTLFLILSCLHPGTARCEARDTLPTPGLFHLWINPQFAPFAYINPALSDSSSSPAVHVLFGAGINAQYRSHLLSLQYRTSRAMFDCLFGCDLPREKTTQLQALFGRAWVPRPWHLSLQGGPSLVYGTGRGRLIGTECAAFLDCESQYEAKTFSGPGLALQATGMLTAPRAGVGLALNLDMNRHHGIYALALIFAFGVIRDEQP